MPQEETKPDDMVYVSDLNSFAEVLTSWHATQIKMIRYMIGIPDGTSTQTGDGPEVVLTGDVLKGFQLGLEFALSQVGELPFHFEIEPPEATPAEAVSPVTLN